MKSRDRDSSSQTSACVVPGLGCRSAVRKRARMRSIGTFDRDAFDPHPWRRHLLSFLYRIAKRLQRIRRVLPIAAAARLNPPGLGIFPNGRVGSERRSLIVSHVELAPALRFQRQPQAHGGSAETAAVADQGGAHAHGRYYGCQRPERGAGPREPPRTEAPPPHPPSSLTARIFSRIERSPIG